MSRGASADHSLMSAPTQKALSTALRSTTTRTDSLASSSRATASRTSSMTLVSALSLSPRARVTVATAPSTERVTGVSVIACFPLRQAQAHGFGAEQTRIHPPQVGSDLERHLRLFEDVALQ